jgi:phosphoribosyl-ATP pyrophosphohydrolase/phosphoribosyl-AMP cyclohydrolase
VILDPDGLDYAKGGGVVTVVTQDDRTGQVLMVAAADREAVACTLVTGEMHYRSRIRGLWRKGATSGQVQKVVSLTMDCDRDALLARVVPAGPSCHTGTVSCFAAAPEGSNVLAELDRLVEVRAEAAEPAGYTGRLLADRNLRLKKLGEETAELTVACADGNREQAVEEAADLVYHTLVAVRAAGGTWNEVLECLRRRRAGNA